MKKGKVSGYQGNQCMKIYNNTIKREKTFRNNFFIYIFSNGTYIGDIPAWDFIYYKEEDIA